MHTYLVSFINTSATQTVEADRVSEEGSFLVFSVKAEGPRAIKVFMAPTSLISNVLLVDKED